MYVYSKDTVPESSNETYRIRKFVIYYYRADHTMRINEPKINNSGFQVVILWRDVNLKIQMVTRTNAIWYQVEKLLQCTCIVSLIVMLIQKLHRKYYEGSIWPTRRYPMDPFKESQKFSDVRMKNPTLSRRITTRYCLNDHFNIYAVVKSLEQWMEKEGQTLSFYVYDIRKNVLEK